jgi:hypothetical protein
MIYHLAMEERTYTAANDTFSLFILHYTIDTRLNRSDLI